MGSEIETAELERILLPPIPGPLPPSFFTDIPQGSAAIFSTLLGTRPFRLLPNPAPVHTILSGSEDDIRNKSYFLFKRYPTIAESIINPPTAWQDLYVYFDAADLWAEGAGFLFHVLGHIVKVNLTKLNLLEQFAREWASFNEARLISMALRQDMLSALQTPDDCAWFGYDNLTSYEKEILNAVLYRHCEAFQAKPTSAPTVGQSEPLQVAMEAQTVLPPLNRCGPVQVAVDKQRLQSAIHPEGPIQIVVEPRRLPYGMNFDPYQHFGRLDHSIPPGLSNVSSQSMALHLEPGESKTRAGSISQYRNSKPYRIHGESFHKTPYPVAPKNGPNTVDNHYIPPDGYYQVTTDQRRGAHAGNSYEYLQRQPSFSKDPVYMLNPPKTLMSLHKEAFGVQSGNYARTSPSYSAQLSQNVSIHGGNSQDRREDLQSPNQIIIVSNDARLHCNGRFNSIDGGTRSKTRESFKQSSRKISWPESDFNKIRTVYVDGFPIEASSGYHLEKLFSECGEVTVVSVIDEKSYAFITFKHPDSASAAIRRFNGYPIEGSKSLLRVQHYRAHPRKVSYTEVNSRQGVPGVSSQPWANDLPASLVHERGCGSRENRKFARITPPRKDGYSLPSTSQNLPPHPFEKARDGLTQTVVPALEPKYLKAQLPTTLPAKPKSSFPISTWSGSPSTIPKPPLNYVHGPTRTPEKEQHSSGAGQVSATRRKNSVDRSGHTSGRHSNGSENFKALRKTPKKQRDPHNDRKTPRFCSSSDGLSINSQGNSPTDSPMKEVPQISAGIPTAESGKVSSVSSNPLAVYATQPNPNANIPGSFNANDNKPQLQYFSGYSGQRIKANSSTSNSDARSDSMSSISSIGPSCCSVLGQPSGLCESTDTNIEILSSENLLVAAAKIATGATIRIAELPIDRKESVTSNELLLQQKKKKYKYKKKSPSQSSGSYIMISGDSSVSQALGNYPSNESTERPKLETRFHLKTSSNTTTSNTTSTATLFLYTNAETAVSLTQKLSIKNVSPGRNAVGSFTLRERSERQSHRTKRSTQSKSSNCDDVFQDTIAGSIKPTQDSKRLSQGKPDTNGPSTPSSSKSNSSSKTARSNGCEDTQTPTRKPQSRQRNNKSDPKVVIPKQQENSKPSTSPVEILSDPLNWPALGSTALQLDTKGGNVQKVPPTLKPLDERPLPPVPIRRDSMASVLSQPPQAVRRLTIDSPNSPLSGGSPLWPVVKRWDGHGRSLVENGDSISTASVNIDDRCMNTNIPRGRRT